MQDLLKAIEEYIPDNYKQNTNDIKLKRIQKYKEMKKILRQEIKELQEKVKNNICQEEVDQEFSLAEWEHDFDQNNGQPEFNSDLDCYSDDELKEKLRIDLDSENIHLKKPIQLSIVGRPNVGKSTLVNALLKNNRMVVDNYPGTTRDSIYIPWNYKVVLEYFRIGKLCWSILLEWRRRI